MPAEHRLHPISILFGFGAVLKSFALPAVLLLFGSRSAGWDWQLVVLLLVIPQAIVSVGRFFSYRYRFEPNELVVRSGFLFRNERHIPYPRIQNLDSIQNLFHRFFRVVEVRVQTGAGAEPEATMSVLPVAALEEMRHRIFAERTQPSPVDPATPITASGDRPAPGRLIHTLPIRELVLSGLVQNRGFIVIATLWGVLWEAGQADRVISSIAGGDTPGLIDFGELWRATIGDGSVATDRILVSIAALAGFLVLTRVFSVGITLIRFTGFALTRIGDDLVTQLGLFTRVMATIPLRRIQTLTIQSGPLLRACRRAAIKVETAGGSASAGGGGSAAREWLAPIIRERDLQALLNEIQPGVNVLEVPWRPVHPRALGRAFRAGLVMATLATIPLAVVLGAPALLGWLGLSGWAWINARQQVARLGWAEVGDAILFRSGWIWQRLTVVRFDKIQAVAIQESPFDRRAKMASVAVDTAGAGETSHRVAIPYLGRETADELHGRLVIEAKNVAFTW